MYIRHHALVAKFSSAGTTCRARSLRLNRYELCKIFNLLVPGSTLLDAAWCRGVTATRDNVNRLAKHNIIFGVMSMIFGVTNEFPVTHFELRGALEQC